MKKLIVNKIYPIGTKRKTANQLIKIKLKCYIKGCKKRIIGIEGYNGAFYHRGKHYDLRNQTYICNTCKKDIQNWIKN